MKRITSIPRLPPRAPESHKGSYGRVLVVAGSRGMAGAAMLTARGALRSGSGLVTVALPEAISTAVAVGVPEATQRLLPELEKTPSSDRTERVAETLGDLAQYQALAIGPGLGQSAGVAWLVRRLLSEFPGGQVVDADALNAVASGTFPVSPRPDRIWTPHPGEFRRLTGAAPTGDEERIRACAEFVESRGGVVCLKGHRTVVSDGKRAYVNESGNPGMATGGSGDVLTGVIASLLGQRPGAATEAGLSPFDTACLGVYLHGRAGDLAAERLGAASLIAGDIVEALPRAFLEHESGGKEDKE